MNYGNGDNYVGMWANGERYYLIFSRETVREFINTTMEIDMRVIF